MPEARRARRISPAKLSAFISAVLEPVTAVELVDFGYNRDVREARRDVWRRADANTSLHLARFELFNAEEFWKLTNDLPEGRNARPELVKAWREATAKQLLTPAPDQTAVTWKRAAARRQCLPISEEAAAEAIAADEAFLAAHPLSRRSAEARS